MDLLLNLKKKKDFKAVTLVVLKLPHVKRERTLSKLYEDNNLLITKLNMGVAKKVIN